MDKNSEPASAAPEEVSEQTGPVPEETSEQTDTSARELIEPFDQILSNNIERLLGSEQGIEGLPISLFTISCIVLLATRETEIETFPYLPPERYTEETLLEELSEISIEPGEDLAVNIQDMIEKGYIEVADDGRYFAKDPTISMAKLIDLIFPKMPGLNLFAYLGQILDEVLAGRKDNNTAIDQFDQMLKMQGVSLEDATASSKKSKKLFPHLKLDTSPPKTKRKKVHSKPAKPTDIYSQLQTQTRVSTTASKSENMPAASDIQQQAVPETEEGGQVLSEQTLREDVGPQGARAEESTQESKSEESYEEREISPDQLSDDPSHSDAESLQREAGDDITQEETAAPPEEDDIEKRIAAFEEQLGITCPLCNTGGIRAQTTTKGKAYYNCSNQDCNFISWGKPYYISCPQCENPFLVEMQGNEGKTILKCPRATCPHWQKFPWEETDEPRQEMETSTKSDDIKQKPRRKVKRRRRVVRRKR